MSSNTVTFKVAGNDILSFADQIRKKNDALTAEMIANSKKQNATAKDQVRDLEQQIKLLEKKNALEAATARGNAVNKRDTRNDTARNEYEAKVAAINSDPTLKKIGKANNIADAREVMEDKNSHSDAMMKDELRTLRESERLQQLQNKMMRDNVDTIKSTSASQVQEMRRNKSDMVDAIDDEEKKDPKFQLANQMAKDEYHEGDSKGIGKQMLGGLLNMTNVQSLMGSVSQLGQSQNGFDMIAPAAKSSGNIIGTAIGAILGSLIEPGGGTMVGAGIGGTFGSMVGDTAGQFEQRRLMAAQEFLGGKNRYEATTQQKLEQGPNMVGMGVSAGDYVTTLRQIAVNTANTAMAAENTKDVLELGKAVGIDQSTASQMITYFRGTNKDISNLVAGVMAKGKSNIFGGGDYTFLNEFMQQFNSLQTELRSKSEKVATGTTFDILKTFDSIGGSYATRDPRSAGKRSTINEALSNPGSDSLQSMAFLAMRKDHPEMDFSQTREEMQKGLASPTYLKSMLSMIDAYGGDRSSKIANLTALTGGNFSDARQLYDGKGKVKRMSTDNIEDQYTGNFTQAAIGKTTVIEENMAKIKNGLLGTWGDGVDAMVSGFTNAMEQALNGAVIQIGDNGVIKFGAIKVNPINPAPTQVNQTKYGDQGYVNESKGFK